MKTALLGLALCLPCVLPASLTGCATTPPSQMALPGTKVRDGVRIEVNKIVGTWTRPLGLEGTVENTTREAIPLFTLRLDGLGYQGSTIGSARAEIEDLGAGEKRRFRANFALPTPHGLHQVMIAEARARR